MFGIDNTQASLLKLSGGSVGMAYQILEYIAFNGPKTYDECAEVLNLSHGSGSVRFSELVKSGCLERTQQHRTTRAGGRAVVHQIAADADFRKHLAKVHRVAKPKSGSSEDQEAMRIATRFIRGWKRTNSKNARKKLAEEVMLGLIALADRP